MNPRACLLLSLPITLSLSARADTLFNREGRNMNLGVASRAGSPEANLALEAARSDLLAAAVTMEDADAAIQQAQRDVEASEDALAHSNEPERRAAARKALEAAREKMASAEKGRKIADKGFAAAKLKVAAAVAADKAARAMRDAPNDPAPRAPRRNHGEPVCRAP